MNALLWTVRLLVAFWVVSGFLFICALLYSEARWGFDQWRAERRLRMLRELVTVAPGYLCGRSRRLTGRELRDLLALERAYLIDNESGPARVQPPRP